MSRQAFEDPHCRRERFLRVEDVVDRIMEGHSKMPRQNLEVSVLINFKAPNP